MVSRPRIKREEFVETVSQFHTYLTSNDKLRWSDNIPSEFFDSPFEEYIDIEIALAKRYMSLWKDDIHGDNYKSSKEKLEACELQKLEAHPMPETFMDKFKDWVVEHCSKEWKSFLSARRQKKLKAKKCKKQVTLASDVYYRLADYRKDLNLSIDDAMIALLDGHQEGNINIAHKGNITNSYEYVAAQQRILELKDMPRAAHGYISDVKSLKAKSEAFLNTEPGKQMLRNNKRDKAHQLEEIERWAKYDGLAELLEVNGQDLTTVEKKEMCSLLLGWSKTEGEAVSWFKTETIPACGGKTPIELCQSGECKSLLEYIRHIDKGGFS